MPPRPNRPAKPAQPVPSPQPPQPGRAPAAPGPSSPQALRPRARTQRLLKSRAFLAGLVVTATAATAILAWSLWPGRATESDHGPATGDVSIATAASGPEPHGGQDPAAPAKPLARPAVATHPCKIVTRNAEGAPAPGFLVLVDDVLALDAHDEPVVTPCEVRLPAGDHTVTAVKKGHRDESQSVRILGETTLEFAPQFEPFAEPAGFLKSRFGQAVVGDELALASLNLDGRVFDPYIAPDGLTIWFAGDRKEGKGIYTARRFSILDEFGAPELVAATQGADLPSSPSLTADQKLLAYTVLGKSRIWSVHRSDAGDPFETRQPLKFTDHDEAWLSAQISGDGETLYCVQERKGVIRTYATARKSLEARFDKKWIPHDLPGTHPCLSQDALRQYLFDGRILNRATRRTTDDTFSEPQPVAELDLRHYVARPRYRQYFVSENEQWLYFADDPEKAGNLYAVRFATTPGWGYVARGKTLAQEAREPVAQAPAKSPGPPAEEMPAEPVAAAPATDPRLLPLPYAAWRAELDPLLAQWNFTKAAERIAAAAAATSLEDDRELIGWDKAEVELMQGFWSDLEQAVGRLKPGDVVRIGALQVEFAAFAEGQLSGKAKDKPVSRSLVEMSPGDLVAIVDRFAPKDDAAAQLRIAAFLVSAPAKTSPPALAARIKKAGAGGRLLLERQGLRKLRLAAQEFRRDNIDAGLKILDALIAAAPKSELADQARQAKEQLYQRSEWRIVGPQRWNRSVPGEYAVAEATNAANAYLVSTDEYGNFQLTLEWKTVGPTSQGAVYFRFKTGDTPRDAAFRIRLVNDYEIRDRPDRFSTGALFDSRGAVRGPKVNAVRQAGAWNTLSLRVEGERVQVAVNGQPVLDTPAIDPKVGPAGYIALDGEFPGITYRKILVYELLPPAASPSAPAAAPAPPTKKPR